MGTATRLCECDRDGYCERYRRDMGGRMRELCAGVNVDLGTAAAFREQWRQEAGEQIEACATPTPKKLLLKTSQAPGDAVAMTAAIYSLHRAHPGKYLTAVESYWPDVFAHNPDVVSHYLPTGASGSVPGFDDVELHYPAIHQSNQRGIHFMQAWCEFLGAALGVSVPLLTNRPHLYFAEYFEDGKQPTIDYWLVCSGGKRDFTTKLWGHERYQEVVRILRSRVEFIQVGGAKPVVPWNASTMGAQEDNHPRLKGVVDMVGQTSLRQLFELARRARGILCGVSLLMHVAAALKKPCIVVAGGREPVPWNAYPTQQYLHTVGALECSDAQGRKGGACWRYRTVPLGDHPVLDANTCQYPVDGTPACMAMITPEEVARLVLRYNGDARQGSDNRCLAR